MAPVHYHQGGFPPELHWPELIPYLGTAAAAVARYDGILAAIPNPDILLSPLSTQEAVLSSRIEGTQATMGEVLGYEAGASPELSEDRREDIREVLNYRRAMRLAEEVLGTLPLSLRLMKQVHGVLMDGVRGHGKAPGEFRKNANWIGPPGSTMKTARFVPIGADKLPDALGTWESFAHSEQPDTLVQLALLHAEFEALHPFLDGNGRLGRMLIPLFLWQQKLIRRPMFYMSAYLEANRDDYYAYLLGISESGNWTSWCKFFLSGVTEQAEQNTAKAQEILELYDALKSVVVAETNSQYAIAALDWIFDRPIFKSTGFVAHSQIPDSTARRILRAFRDLGLVKEIRPAAGRRPATYTFPRLLNIADGSETF